MFSLRAGRPQVRKTRRNFAQPTSAFETLEDRILLSAFTVSTLNDAGNGSLRQAILNANANHGADVINFTVAGTIVLNSALPNVIDTVNIDGTSAPGFASTPVVEVNFNGHAGLDFTANASGSELQSLSLVNASTNGVTLNAVHQMIIAGNFVGVETDGVTTAANNGSGIALTNSTGNTIGGPSLLDGNIVSGNSQQGILLSGSSTNIVENNYIGTDATGTIALGNGFNGVLISGHAVGNLIGGEETGGNDPTQGTFVRPPEGNLISGNGGDGVLITNHASQNQLSGNFIGTDASGNAALGNTLDGVAIVSANNNSLLGCTIQTNPFVFYNVISGNGGNGLTVNNSNNTTIQANFFGMGANNDTAVGNGQNGVVVEGSSSHTTMGGPIPLGNVDAANAQNGIVVRDHASFFTSYNTFCGLAAFSTDPNFGNGGDGMLITSTGGSILIRTNVITENGRDGVEIAGAAQGVRVTGNIIGLDTNGQAEMGNLGNGVEVGGSAHNIVVGGPQPTFNVVPQNTISANGENGVAITGSAHSITVNNGFIGTNATGLQTFGNDEAGIYIGPGTSKNVIGSPEPSLTTIISGNGASGINMEGTTGNTVVGTWIGLDRNGNLPFGNDGNGILINNSSRNIIGGVGANGNHIVASGLDGVFVESGTGNGIHENSIFGSDGLGIDLGSGANLNQAAPVLSSVQASGPGLQVTGRLTSRPNTVFTVEFFANDTSAPSGRVFLGLLKVKTNSAGTIVFTSNQFLRPLGSTFITATATDGANNTSEFSNAVS
ncbi:MAG TPA: LEPR-XLL domain-containing protein [Planctomycetaceae bacterium]|jgi:parallel beta-helix repeat protein|nr:LEPR-XLL domain-containing protein [Planctomycetaceae bacterium]